MKITLSNDEVKDIIIAHAKGLFPGTNPALDYFHHFGDVTVDLHPPFASPVLQAQPEPPPAPAPLPDVDDDGVPL